MSGPSLRGIVESFLVFAMAGSIPQLRAADPIVNTERGDRMIASYFAAETDQVRQAALADVRSRGDWESRREESRQQLKEMLGLDPWPEKTDLRATVTRSVHHPEFRVDNIHFQSRPGLYVTGNLYVPHHREGRLPAILYVCGHGPVKKDGVSYGNKVTYQHHGAWFARHGYVCLTIDTLQLGEIEGIHHGTYRYNMWWWLNRGYTSAGVEAWNCVRALDYLQSLPEVDGSRLGVTGRSGGGAYSWWIAALDDRIQCAVPVAGITDLQNHVVDGCVEGHCDCMYMVNTHRWDYAQVAALVAPRPLLISNTDTDRIFPLDGVVRLFEQTRRVYGLLGAADRVALNITAGGHRDTQELQVHAFRWFNHHLQKHDNLIEKPAVKFFEPEQLQVFYAGIPPDQLNTRIQETFVPAATVPPVPGSAAEWQKLREGWFQALSEKSFGGWPRTADSLAMRELSRSDREGVTLRVVEFQSQKTVPLRLFLLHSTNADRAPQVHLQVLNDAGWKQFLGAARVAFAETLAEEVATPPQPDDFRLWREQLQGGKVLLAFLAPRGVGPTAWDGSDRKQVQHQRRFYLLGQTLDGMQVWDIRRAVQALRQRPECATARLTVGAEGPMAGNALYAALFEKVEGLELQRLPPTHHDGPYYLNVQRYLDLPQAVAMAAERTPVRLTGANVESWKWSIETVRQQGWPSEQLHVGAADGK